MKAPEVLLAIRKKYAKFPVIREVTVDNPYYEPMHRRWQLQGPRADWYAEHYAKLGWEVADSIPDGWQPRDAKPYRRIDALLFDKYLTAIEIKVTRSDFKADTEEKRAPWRYYTNKFVYAVPEGLVAPDEVPDYAGLWYVDESGIGPSPWQHGVTVAKKAKIQECKELPDSLIRSLLGRLSRYEYEGESGQNHPHRVT